LNSEKKKHTASISVIVPTIGRAESLRRLLHSLSLQTFKVNEVIVADASRREETSAVAHDHQWASANLTVTHLRINAANAVRQREAAIEVAKGEYLLFLDDDVALEADCVEQMVTLLQKNPDAVAATADFNNQTWPQPTRLWRLYLNYGLGIPTNLWQGRVVGPLLRFGYNPTPTEPKSVEWLGTGNSLIRRSAYDETGGFSKFFLHRSTINEDVDLSLKLARLGTILFCPSARMSHYHAPEGRVSRKVAAEDDLFNRFFILRRTLNYSATRAFSSIAIYFGVETMSSLLGAVRRMSFEDFFDRLTGHLRGLSQIINQPRRAEGIQT
jgi:GT2 family glycosyltransferase